MIRGIGRDMVGRFLAEERGTASMEFVVTLPLLLGPMIVTAEYGDALSARERLDSAVAEAAHLLAHAPAMPGPAPTDPPVLIQRFVDRAEALVAARMGATAEQVLFEATVTADVSGGLLRPYHLIQVRAVVGLDLSLLGFFNTYFSSADPDYVLGQALPILAVDEARFVSSVPPIDLVPCTYSDPPAPATDLAACRATISAVAAAPGDTASIDAYFPGSGI